MKFEKPALPIPELLGKWRDRGLQIQDASEAEHYLRFIGYYRLSAYALPLQESVASVDAGVDKPFKVGASFGDILNLYRFDRELRLLFMDAIERIEVAVRTCIVNEMSLAHGPHWFMDAVHFNPNARRFKHHQFLDLVDKELKIANGSKSPHKPHHEVFINHYYDTYTEPYLPPAWMIAETLTLGTWSQIFENLRVTEKRKAIAYPLQTDERVLRNWLHALTYLRNLCAHHSRLWNRKLVIKPVITNRHAPFLKANDRCYSMAVVAEDLLRIIAPGTSWAQRLHHLLASHPYADPAAMGFPVGWESEPFWILQPNL
jgi:abortive infection bacteriophage resistance protein